MIIHDAIRNTHPTVVSVTGMGTECRGYDVNSQEVALDWSLIEPENARLQAIADSLAYQQQRRLAYPRINDQLDMLWHAIDQGKLDKTSDFYTALATVKAQYPKGDTQ